MRYVLSFVSLWLLVTLVGCQKESFLEEGEGDKVALEFDLYQANVTKAAAVSALNDKALIKVYAFKVETKTETGTKTGTGETGTPSAEGTYVVGADGKVTAQSGKALFLYRGVYNLYFTSYNEENAPELGDGNLVTVQNGQDFMYTFMNDITVQPQKAGQNTMSVTLTNPFTRLCSQVEVSVKAASVSPVTVKGLRVNFITMKNLSDSRTYRLGDNAWYSDGVANENNGVDFSSFNNSVAVGLPHTSDPRKIVLPLSGSELQFVIDLTVDYDKNGNGGSVPGHFVFNATARKTFLPGMSYSFEFTLKFFGDFKETELTLGILEFTVIKNVTDPVGGE